MIYKLVEIPTFNATPVLRGDVSTFRRALWAEHLGTWGGEAPLALELEPHSVECAREVSGVRG